MVRGTLDLDKIIISASNYVDRQGTTIKDGCCECGGGTMENLLVKLTDKK